MLSSWSIMAGLSSFDLNRFTSGRIQLTLITSFGPVKCARWFAQLVTLGALDTREAHTRTVYLEELSGFF